MISKNAQFITGFAMVTTSGVADTTTAVTTEVSKDGGSFAATTNSATRIGSTNCFNITLTATEMNCDLLMLKVTGASLIPVVITINPELSWTATKAGYVDASISTRSSQISADDIPTNAEFEARTLATADYVVVGDTIAGITDKSGFALTADYDPAKTHIDISILALESTSQTILSNTSNMQFDENGGGSIPFTYTVYSDAPQTLPLSGCKVWITTDEAGLNIVCPAKFSNLFGETTWTLDAGTYYIWRSKVGYIFDNPDTEIIEAGV